MARFCSYQVSVGFSMTRRRVFVAAVDGEANRARLFRREAGGADQLQGDRLVERGLGAAATDHDVRLAEVVLALDELVEADAPGEALGLVGRDVAARAATRAAVRGATGCGVVGGGPGLGRRAGRRDGGREPLERGVALELDADVLEDLAVDGHRGADPLLLAGLGEGREHGLVVGLVVLDRDRVDLGGVEEAGARRRRRRDRTGDTARRRAAAFTGGRKGDPRDGSQDGAGDPPPVPGSHPGCVHGRAFRVGRGAQADNPAHRGTLWAPAVRGL